MIKSLYYCFILFFFITGIASNAQFKYPPARKQAFDTVIYNTKLSDEYRWMSLPDNKKEMEEYAREQGKLTEAMLDSISGTDMITALRKKVNESFSPDDMDVFGVQEKTMYYYKLVDGKNKWHLMNRQGYDGKEETILDTSFIVNNRIYIIKKFSFAFKKPLVAMMMMESGELNPHVRFYDLEKKQFLTDSIGPVMFNDSRGVSMTWLPDDKGLIYSQAPPDNNSEEKYFRGKLKVHIIGTDQQKDMAVFGKGVNEKIDIQGHETPYIYSFPLSPYIIARIRAGKGDNYAFAVHYSKLDGVRTPWVKLKDYVCNDATFTAKGEYLYGVVDNVPNKRVVKVNMKTGEPPVVFLSEQQKILEGTIVTGKEALFVKYTSPGRSGILKMKYTDSRPVDLSMPYDGTVSGIKMLGDNDLIFSISNWIRSPEWYIISQQTNEVKMIPGSGTSSFAEQFTSKVIYVPSRDGLQIPVSLVYSKNIIPGEKSQRILIDAYGCGGSSMDPALNADNFTWLGMGGIYAIAHIRGGGELGAEWTKSGSYPTKMNSINDFVDVAEFFVKNNYTTPSMQTMTGASCGTINVGLAALQRPDLFSAGVYEVGTPDFVTAREASYARGQNIFGPLDTEDGFKARLSISAYHHISENKKAPAMLIINGATDYIVKLHNVARYVARLQNIQLSERPVLFMVDWKGGHADAGTSRADRIRKWKFLLWQTGHPDFQLKK